MHINLLFPLDHASTGGRNPMWNHVRDPCVEPRSFYTSDYFLNKLNNALTNHSIANLLVNTN